MAFEVTVTPKIYDGFSFVALSPDAVNRADIGASTFQLVLTFSEPANTAVTPLVFFSSGENPSSVLNAAGAVWSAGNTVYTITYSVADNPTFQIDDIDVRVTAFSGTGEWLGGAPYGSVTVADVFSLDLAAPTAGTPDLDDASDTGASDSDNVTNQTVPTLNVALSTTTEVGDTVSILDSLNNVLAFHVVTAADVLAATVALTLDSALSEGDHELTAVVNDPAGNQTSSATLEVTVDTTGPVTPQVDTIDAPAGDTVTLTGTADPDANTTTVVSVGGQDHTVVVDGSGNWSLELDLDDVGLDVDENGMPNAVTITSTDLAGNSSAASGSFTVGLEGDNTVVNTAADETFALGDGTDTVVFSQNVADYNATFVGGGVIEVTGPDGTDTLSDVEVMQFADTTVLMVDDDGEYGSFTTIQSAVAFAKANPMANPYTILVRDGDYTLTSTLTLDFGVRIIGESEAGVQIDASAVTSYGILVEGDNVSLANFTFQGPGGTSSARYGIKVQPDTGDRDDLLLNFSLANVTVKGSGGSEVDLNGVNGASLTDITVDGQGSKGVGIAITDSQNVTLNNIETMNNGWGAVAIYPTNTYYDSPVKNISFTGTFETNEPIGLFVEVKPGSQPLGTVNLPTAWGEVWTVTNEEHRADGKGALFTFYVGSQAEAEALGAMLEGGGPGLVVNSNSVITDPAGVIHGTTLVDTYHLDGDWQDFDVSVDGGTGIITLTDNRPGSPEGSVQVIGFANFSFNDGDAAVGELPNDAPDNLTATLSVAEDAAVGAVVGTVSVSDADTLDSHSYALLDDAGGRFVIDATTGEVTVASGASFDFETEGNIDLEVEVTDAHGATYSETLTVSVGDVNEAPSVALTNVVSDIDENTELTSSFKVADIVITDDASGTNELSLTGANADLFEIVDTGTGFELHLKAGTTLNHESLASLEVTVNVIDAEAGSYAVGHVVSVNDVNEAPVFGYQQGFATDAAGISTAGGAYGDVLFGVASGSDGIATPDGSAYAVFTQTAGGNPADATGPYTFFGGAGHREFVDGATSSVTVYLDTNWADGEGFDYSVSAANTSGTHLRDFIFHVSKDTSTGDLLVGGSNNTNFNPRQDLDSASYTNSADGPAYVVPSSGWYTLQHVFNDDGGQLSVSMNLIDANGDVVWTETRSDAGDVIGTNVGGIYYGWFTNIDIEGGVAVNDLRIGDYVADLAELAEGDAGEGTLDHDATGTITYRDVDVGDAHVLDVVEPDGAIGTFSASIENADGDGEGLVRWTFAVNDAAVEYLKAGEVLTQTYSLTLTDDGGNAVTREVTVTVTGAADSPIISGDVSGTADESDAALVITGSLAADDADAAESGFQVESGAAANGGTFSIDANGAWTYTADSAHDDLNVGESFTDSFTVHTVDGTAQVVDVTIEGTNDAPVAVDLPTSLNAYETAELPGIIEASFAEGRPDLGHNYVLSAGVLADMDALVMTDPSGVEAVLGNLVAEVGTLPVAIAVLWDFLDHAYTSFADYYDPNTNESFIRLGVAYAEYLQDGGVPLDDIVAKASTATRAQTLHDNLMGNLWWGAIQDRFDPNTAGREAILDLLVDKGFLDASLKAGLLASDVNPSTLGPEYGVLTRPYFDGVVTKDNGPAHSWDSENGFGSGFGKVMVSDPDSSSFTFAAAQKSGTPGLATLHVDANGEYWVTVDDALAAALGEGASENVVWTLTVSDEDGGSTEYDITIAVNGANDLPVISGDATGSAAETDAAVEITGQLDATDADSGESGFQAAAGATANGGTFEVDASGAWTYTAGSAHDNLNIGDSFTDSFVVKTIDGTEQLVEVTINGTNDAPVATSSDPVVGEAFEGPDLDVTGADVGPYNGSGNGNLVANYALSASAQAGLDALVGEFGPPAVAGVPGNTAAVLADLTLELGSSAAAIAVMWDFLDDAYTSDPAAPPGYYNATLGEAFIRLGVEYVSYLQAGGLALTNVVAKYTQDNGDADTLPQRQQSMHDNLLGNFNFADFKSRFPANSVVRAELVDLLVANNLLPFAFGETLKTSNPALPEGYLARPAFSGSAGADASATQQFDLDNDLLPDASGQLAANDADDNSTLTWSGSDAGTYGNLVVNPDGTWSYTLDESLAATQALGAGDSEVETFTATVTDEHGATDTVTIQITVHGTDDRPVVTGDVSGNADETDAAVVITGSLVAEDADDGESGFQAASGNSDNGGSFSIDASGNWTYTADGAHDELNVGESFTDSFTVYTADGTAQVVEVTINGTNDAPVAKDFVSPFTYDEDTINGPINFGTIPSELVSDVDDDVSSFDASHFAIGMVSIDGGPEMSAADAGISVDLSGNITIDTNVAAYQGLGIGETADVVVKFTVTDDGGLSDEGQVTFAVAGANDDPTISFEGSFEADEDTPIVLAYADMQNLYEAFIDDVDGDAVEVTVQVVDEADAVLHTFVYPNVGEDDFSFVHPDANFNSTQGTLKLVFSLDDGNGGTAEREYSLTINAVTDLEAQDDAFSADEDNVISDSVAANDSTSSGGLLSYELVSGPAAGTLVLNADGSFTYTPDADDFGDYSFEYKVIDTASGEEAQRTATLSIASVNDDPDGGAPLAAALSEDDVSPTVIDLLDGASDVEGDTLSVVNWTVLSGNDVGFSLSGDQLVVDPSPYQYLSEGQDETVVVEVEISDGNGGSAVRTVTVTVNGFNEVVHGTQYDDVGLFAVQGTNFSDTIDAGDGDDTVYGASGNDIIFGEGGDDAIYGGSGDDSVDAGLGDDYVDGGSGNDDLLGGEGDDTILGGNGNDTITGGLGRDVLTGGSGVDTFVYTDLHESQPGDGRDIITDFTSVDKLDLTAIADQIGGFTFVGKGTVSRSFEYGNLKYYHTGGNTYVVGDTDGDGQADFQIQLMGEVALSADNILGIAHTVIFGTSGIDTLTGTSGDDVIIGRGGADILNGDAGSDTFVLLSVADSNVSGTRDTIQNWDSSDILDVSAIDANGSLTGNQDFVFMGEGTVNRTVGQGQIKYYHTGGNTYVVGNNTADDQADFQIQIQGIHHLTADNFEGIVDDVLLGTAGADTLTAPDDDGHIFVGGRGKDLLVGGLGPDTFILGSVADSTAGSARDVIQSWTANDVIDVAAIDADSDALNGLTGFVFDGEGAVNRTVDVGHIKYYHTGGNTYVVGSVGPDTDADFQIEIQGVHVLTADNFEGLL